ncbi:MAG: helix-turn-helix transcriptional regulator [Elusimicrobiales bacterium]|nr:helix-turn-helix transcriptional regulator [Elusimicrobiales bacterium]
MDNEVYAAVGRAVRSARDGFGWTQEELGDRCGLHPSYIGQIERGVKKVSLATLYALSLALKLRVSALLGEKNGGARPASALEARIAGLLMGKTQRQREFAFRMMKAAMKLCPRN